MCDFNNLTTIMYSYESCMHLAFSLLFDWSDLTYVPICEESSQTLVTKYKEVNPIQVPQSA